VTGAYGPEKVQKLADVQPDSEDEEAKEFVKKLSQWRKGDVSTKKKKVRYIYKSVDDVLEQGKTGSSGKREYRYVRQYACVIPHIQLSRFISLHQVSVVAKHHGTIIFLTSKRYVRFEGFHGGDYEECCLLGCYSVSLL
jgi:hypothetical protein